METQTFEQNNKTTSVHTYDIDEPCYPFAIVEQIETEQEKEIKHSYEIALGNSKVEERSFKTKEDAEKFIMAKPYSLILALFCYSLELKEKYEKEQQQLKTQKDEIQQ